jgi:hypothetical protein
MARKKKTGEMIAVPEHEYTSERTFFVCRDYDSAYAVASNLDDAKTIARAMEGEGKHVEFIDEVYGYEHTLHMGW